MSVEHIKIEGLTALRDKLLQLGAVGGLKVLASASRNAMKPTLDAAKNSVPVCTGLLRDTIRLAVVKPRSGDVVCSAGLTFKKQVPGELENAADEFSENAAAGVKVKGAGWRWHFIEFGTRKMAAKPYLRPAFQMTVHTCVDRLKTSLRQKIRNAIRKAGGTP